VNNTLPLPGLSHEVWQRPFVKAYRQWCEDFVVELRLRGVPGPEIGERLAEVEGHCAETGETPQQAFGDPTGYARRIDEESSPERVTGVWKVAALASAQVLAMLVGTAAVGAWAGGSRLTYDLVQVGGLVLCLLVLLSLPLLLRLLVRRPWAAGVPLVAAMTLGGVGAALSGRFDLPAVLDLPAPAVAVGLFAVVLVLGWLEYRELARDAAGDLVTSPLTPTPGAATTGRRIRLAALLPAGLIPAVHLALAAVTWTLA
jgi:hypothetical protein